MTISFRDRDLRRLFENMLTDNRLSKPEVDKLIESTQDWFGLSRTERRDLVGLLDNVGDKMDADAKATLQAFLGLPVDPMGGGEADAVTVTVTPASRRAAGVSDITKLAETFALEMRERSSELAKPEDAFKLFAEYGGRLKALSAGLDPRVVDDAADALLAAGRESPARGYDSKDSDHDTRSDLHEAARGRDATKFDVRDEEIGKLWNTTYWPMAGSGDNDQAGNANQHLWAKEGPLAKLDSLIKARGMADQAKALEFERKPALGWLVGDRNTGHMINSSTLSESDAEMSTGVDFDGDGKITRGVKVDFLGPNDKFASVRSRNQFVPKVTLDGEVIDLRRERITGEEGAVSFKFFRKDTGAELTTEEAKAVFYANPVSGDGEVDGSTDVGWWGSCDKVALAGILFKEPMKDSVTVDGVTFTKQDMLGLLTIIANSQASGSDFVGNRFDGRPDILVMKDGRQLSGKFVGVDDDTFRGGEGMWRSQGDYMVLTDPFKDDPEREFTFRQLDGTEKKVKASEIARMGREDEQDISPIEFHSTLLKWLEDGRGAAMDKDAGDHVWNYSFHGATLKSAEELSGADRPSEPGFNGAIGEGSKVVEFEMDVRFAKANWPTEYRYWIEFDDTGKPVNAGWKSDNPDFLWRPSGFKNFTGHNERNPFVKPEIVKEIYDKFMEE